jgi:ADP-heptose:LPS heptosyltransferase
VTRAGLEYALARGVVAAENRLLGWLVRAGFRRRPGTPERILVFRSSAIGDFVCALPALHRLRQRFPRSHIVLLTTPTGNPRYWRQMPEAGGRQLAGRDLVDDVIFFYAHELKRPQKFLELRRRVRALAPDMTFLLPFSGEPFLNRLKKIVFLRLLGVRWNLNGYEMRSNLGVFPQAQFLRGDFPHQVVSALHAVDGRHSVATAAARRVDELWAQRGLEGNRAVVVLSPGARFLHKRWPLENFAALAERLLEEFPVSLVVIGGREDHELGAVLAAARPARVHNLAGDTTLPETAEVLRRGCLFIGNDSGAAHLAAAVGIPCVTLFSGVTFPGLWEPWGERNVALRHRVPCEFCFSEGHCPTGTMECIRGISVERVLAAARGLLQPMLRVPAEMAEVSAGKSGSEGV